MANLKKIQEILLNIESKEMRYAHLRNGLLQDLVIERKKARQLAGNIYRGQVTNILTNIQSAFININEKDNGFIHISDILENTKKFEEMFDMDFETKKKNIDDKNTDIAKVLEPNQPVLVQVIKEAIGSKGARLTSNVTVAGRYLVLLPNTPHRGVSRKIEDRQTRERLKKFLRLFDLPGEMGLICRTAGQKATSDQLIQEAQDLFRIWEKIVVDFEKSKGPQLLYQESDLIKRAVITAIDKKMERLLVDDHRVFQICKNLAAPYKQEHDLKIELYRDSIPIFERFNVEKEIDRALKRKIWLPSGGYLFFDRTEAMTTIDVNSGRAQLKKEVSNLEEALVHINFEAAQEIARQLRLRNVGGLIICDFIDMRFRKNQRRVLERLKDQMKEDSAKCTVLGMSEFGLAEMTRQRQREALDQTIFNDCPYCNGLGKIKSLDSVSIEIERSLKKVIRFNEQYGLKLRCHPNVDAYLSIDDKAHLVDIAVHLNAKLEFETSEDLHLTDFEFYSLTNDEKIEV
ncbi:MAG: Ribonuclease G [Chlamydiae bacterium]|nr:Ribonuclease G [Chlamydiota bacterium]